MWKECQVKIGIGIGKNLQKSNAIVVFSWQSNVSWESSPVLDCSCRDVPCCRKDTVLDCSWNWETSMVLVINLLLRILLLTRSEHWEHVFGVFALKWTPYHSVHKSMTENGRWVILAKKFTMNLLVNILKMIMMMSKNLVDEQPEAMLGNPRHHQEMGKQSPLTIVIKCQKNSHI